MSAPTGASSDADLARALAAHYANASARVPEGELLLGPVARHMPSAPPTSARCEEEDGDGEEEELLLRRVAYAPQVGAGGVVGGVANCEVVVPSAVISSTCTSSWGGLVLDANAWHGGGSAAEVPGVVLLSSSRSELPLVPPSALATTVASLLPPRAAPAASAPGGAAGAGTTGGFRAAVPSHAFTSTASAATAQPSCHLCGGVRTGNLRLTENLATAFSAAAVSVGGSPIEPYVRHGEPICRKCYLSTEHTRAYCAANLTPAQLEPALVESDEAVAAPKRKAATVAAREFNKKINAHGARRVVAELRPARRASLAARRAPAEPDDGAPAAAAAQAVATDDDDGALVAAAADDDDGAAAAAPSSAAPPSFAVGDMVDILACT